MKMLKVKCFTVRLFLILFTVSVINSNGQAVATGKRNPTKSESIDSKQLIRDIKFLSSDALSGREAGSEAGEVARKYVLGRFKKSGLKPFGADYTQTFSFKTRSDQTINGVNVIGYIKGKSLPDKYVVVTAHYDHVGVREGKVYNGADDNASGTAALFALAKYFKKNKPKHSLIFVAFDAEEKGLQGARYFVKNLPVPKDSILLNINMDMVSRNDKNELYVAGGYHYPFIKKYVEAVKKDAPVKLLFGHDDPKLGREDWTSQSDHGAFHREKIPFIYFGVEDHKDYHKPTDTFENINQKFYVDAVESILMVVKSVDRDYRN